MSRHQCTTRCSVMLADGGHACALTLVALEGPMSCERIGLLLGVSKQAVEAWLRAAHERLGPRARLMRLGD